ncbi:MAG: hypothetical protein LBV39_06380, partial [Bacteroidales bacterium]|nr:hypothetical protein [Bacteroidales bacterium]
LFILTRLETSLAVIALIGAAVWNIGALNFRFAKIKDFLQAILIHVGYLLIAGAIFIFAGTW